MSRFDNEYLQRVRAARSKHEARMTEHREALKLRKDLLKRQEREAEADFKKKLNESLSEESSDVEQALRWVRDKEAVAA